MGAQENSLFKTAEIVQHSGVKPSEFLESLSRRVFVLGMGLLCLTPERAVVGDVRYNTDIQPIFETHCYRCHGMGKSKGGLRLDAPTSAMRVLDSGEKIIAPGEPDRSLLLRRVTSVDKKERMPQDDAPLSAEQIETLREWIEAGAVWPEADSMNAGDADIGEETEHWAFRPLQAVEPPSDVDSSWSRTPVDSFVASAHRAASLTPSPRADARTLIRRLYFDLVGLPPAPDEMAEWSERIERAPDEVDHLIETLLQSERYGERWGRHWLDVARFADSNGMELDADRPNAFRYRDFVIRAFNEDLPFDTFVRWQLAGDEIAPDEPEAIAATGFIAAGVNTILPDKQMVEEKLRNRANELDDMVSTTGQAFLGLTLACARCHDHKYDPIPTMDYYRLTRIFNNGDRAEVPMAGPDVVSEHKRNMASWTKRQDAAKRERDGWFAKAREAVDSELRRGKIEALEISAEEKRVLIEEPESARAGELEKKYEKRLQISESESVAALAPEDQAEWAALTERVERISVEKPEALPVAFAFADFGSEPAETWFFNRGDFTAREETMSMGFLSTLTRGKTATDYWNDAKETRLRDDSAYQRKALADWMTDLDHGAGALLARVFVNRVWQGHFGEGLARTPNDFGTRGERPTHPELLEWLSSEFVRSGWSVKSLHRLILRSATYQQASIHDASRAAIDPDNRFLWRQRPVRLEAEALRDAMLFAAGTLNPKMYGPGFKPPIQLEALQARNVTNPYPKDLEETSETKRRSIYMFHKRVVPYPLFQAFDAPDAQQSCGRRLNTTVAPQALAILNDPFVRNRAGEMAERLRNDAGADPSAQALLAFQYAFNRQPSADELAESVAFIESQEQRRMSRGESNADIVALTDFLHLIFGANEFIYID